LAKKIGEILVGKGLVTESQVTQGLEAQKFHGGRLGSALLELGFVEEKDLLAALCEQKKAQPAKAGQLKAVVKATLDLLPVKVAVRYQVIPLQRENRRLSVAITDPNDLLALDELAFITGCVIEPLLATERTILNALELYYGVPRRRRTPVGVAPLAHRPGPPAPIGPLPPPTEVAQDLVLEDADAERAREFWRTDAASPRGAAAAPLTGPLPSPPPLHAVTAPTSAPTTAPLDMATTQSTSPTGPERPERPEHLEQLERPEQLEPPAAQESVEQGVATAVVAEDVPKTMEEASRRLAQCDVRDDIADVILWCTEDLFRRSALFIFQKSRTLGWTGQGNGLQPHHVRKVVQPVEEVSVFTLVRDSARHYQGALPDNAGNKRVLEALGGEWPPAVLVVPFGIKGRALGCFYAEDAAAELEQVDLNMLFKLLQKAGLALEMLLLRSKIMLH
jgi:hypothetical protein